MSNTSSKSSLERRRRHSTNRSDAVRERLFLSLLEGTAQIQKFRSENILLERKTQHNRRIISPTMNEMHLQNFETLNLFNDGASERRRLRKRRSYHPSHSKPESCTTLPLLRIPHQFSCENADPTIQSDDSNVRILYNASSLESQINLLAIQASFSFKSMTQMSKSCTTLPLLNPK